jgi:hypothetical protein
MLLKIDLAGKTMKEFKDKKPQVKLYAKLALERYSKMRKKEKGVYLKQLSQDCGVSLQHARRVMSKLQTESKKPRRAEYKKPGPKSKYQEDAVIWWLQTFWVGLGHPNTKLMPVMLKEWLVHFKEEGFGEEIRAKLLKMSSSTMESLLKSYKRENGKKHFIATKNKKGRLKKMLVRIPERKLDFKVETSGFCEADTVAHCGDRLQGRHGWSLNLCCIHSSWTETEAFLGKEMESIVEGLSLMRARLPFPMHGLHSDCGSEFINDALASYLEDPRHYVVQTHGRAYKKNDQARVEQKNWTQVRESFGYDRVEQQRVVDAMNDIYRNELRIIRNFFTPTQKQKSKVRIGSKYRRKFETPKTPYERILEDAGVSQEVKDRLREEKKSYNPFAVKKRLDEKLKFFEKMLQNQNKITEEKANSVEQGSKDVA